MIFQEYFAAGASGSGKTPITCGLLQALVNRKMKKWHLLNAIGLYRSHVSFQSHRDEIQKSDTFLQMPRLPDTCLEKMQIVILQ